ncbi:MAG: 5'/3'-nucleotidase SurE [Clostridia bacterium]|nr:5'/3'-nucleotidase SurE [Clostridia bacterium]
MYILISNDDGVNAQGIKTLYKTALKMGHEVLVCAPSAQCSAMSESLTLGKPLLLHRIKEEESLSIYSVDGTPSDCVRIGAQLAKKKIDVCLTGINHGENVSTGVYYSGTVSAAREASMLYIPAIAVSLAAGGSLKGFEAVAAYALKMAEHIVTMPSVRYGVFNINAPKGDPQTWKEPVLCPISSAYFIDGYEKRVSPYGQEYFWTCPPKGKPDGLYMEPHAEGTDASLLAEGHITCTMIGALACENTLCINDFDKWNL